MSAISQNSSYFETTLLLQLQNDWVFEGCPLDSRWKSRWKYALEGVRDENPVAAVNAAKFGVALSKNDSKKLVFFAKELINVFPELAQHNPAEVLATTYFMTENWLLKDDVGTYFDRMLKSILPTLAEKAPLEMSKMALMGAHVAQSHTYRDGFINALHENVPRAREIDPLCAAKNLMSAMEYVKDETVKGLLQDSLIDTIPLIPLEKRLDFIDYGLKNTSSYAQRDLLLDYLLPILPTLDPLEASQVVQSRLNHIDVPLQTKEKFLDVLGGTLPLLEPKDAIKAALKGVEKSDTEGQRSRFLEALEQACRTNIPAPTLIKLCAKVDFNEIAAPANEQSPALVVARVLRETINETSSSPTEVFTNLTAVVQTKNHPLIAFVLGSVEKKEQQKTIKNLMAFSG